MRILCLIALPLALSGCIAKTAVDIVTAPVKAGAQVVDWTTTSQDEADRNRGREIRRAEERARKECRREVEGDYARETCTREKLRAAGIY